MMRVLSVAAGIGIVLACGVVQGFWTNRWGEAAEMQAARERVAGLPKTIGDWEGEDLQLSEQDQQAAGVAGYVLRRYANQRTGEEMRVLLLCGPSGPIAVHTPDVCYAGAGNEIVKDPAGRTIPMDAPTPASDFQMIEVRSQQGREVARLHVYWSWSARGKWQTPRHPRLTFAPYRVLYKLYVIHRLAGDGDAAAEDSEAAFIKLLVPEAQKCLYGGA